MTELLYLTESFRYVAKARVLEVTEWDGVPALVSLEVRDSEQPGKELKMVHERYKNELVTIIKKHAPRAVIYLFGSRARGDEVPTSDIDIAVDAGAPLDYEIFLKILIEVDETTIPQKVDLVDLQTASAALKEQILKEGIKWTN